MAHPKAASLNSLADVLRQVKPVYDECRRILNYIDTKATDAAPMMLDELLSTVESKTAKNDAASISHVEFELRRRRPKHHFQ